MTLLDPLSVNEPIVDPQGRPTTEFMRKWSTMRHIKAGVDSFLLALTGTVSSASLLFRIREVTPTAGAEATIALEVRAGEGENFRTASIKLSALAGTDSRIELTADEIVLDGTVLSSGGIVTSSLAANAATLPGSRSGTGTIACAAANAWTLIDSFTDTFTGQPVTIWPGIEFDNTDSADHTFTVALTLDSTDPATSPIFTPVGTIVALKSPASHLFNFPIPDEPSAGSHTYRVYFKALDTNTNVRARFWNIAYMENKR